MAGLKKTCSLHFAGRRSLSWFPAVVWINVVLVCCAQQDPKALEATAVPASLVPCSAIGPGHIPKAFAIHINQTCCSSLTLD